VTNASVETHRNEIVKLYYNRNLNPRVAVAVAKYLASPVEFILAHPRDPKQEEAFRAINPNTLVPVLVENGRSLWETDAIAFRLARIAGSDFWPTDVRMTEMFEWLSWSAQHFTQAGGTFYFVNIIVPQFFTRAPDAHALDEASREFHRYAAVLEQILADRTWLVGDQLSYADFRVASALPFAAKGEIPVGRYSRIVKWHERLNQIDSWRDPFDGLVT
jgi:glutathione S-transferase